MKWGLMKRERNMGWSFPTTEKMETLSQDKFWPVTEMTRICRDARDVRAQTEINILAIGTDAIGSSMKSFTALHYLILRNLCWYHPLIFLKKNYKEEKGMRNQLSVTKLTGGSTEIKTQVSFPSQGLHPCHSSHQASK